MLAEPLAVRWGRQEYGIGLIDLLVVLDGYVSKGQQAAGKIACGGDGALERVGVEPHFIGGRRRVPLQQFFFFQPLAEILAHQQFQLGAAGRELAGGALPGEPGMGGELGEGGITSGQGGADIVAAEN
nr:hypothetical protein [Selenomonas caprae]